jgi:hypothetical protein
MACHSELVGEICVNSTAACESVRAVAGRNPFGVAWRQVGIVNLGQ